MPDRILVDANSVGHAGHQGTVLKSGDQETQAIFAVVRAAHQMRVRNPGAAILFLWDGRSWRKDVLETYKANRTDTAQKHTDRERYKSQAPLIRRALILLGVPQLFALNLEADDLAAILSQRYTRAGDNVRLISGDRDWLQLVNERCIWEDHRDATKVVNLAAFEAKTGYKTAAQFVQSKALQGDTSDNVPGVGKIGGKGAAELLSIWGDVRAFLADATPEVTYGKRLPKAFTDFRAMKDRQDRFFLNMRLMNLLGDLPAPESMTLINRSCDPEKFRELCNELHFRTIANDFDNWIAPFMKGAR